MKKALLIIALLAPLAAFSQTKASVPVPAKVQPKDTTIQVTMTLDQFKSLLYVIDQNIDSKRESKQVIDFLTHSARIVEDKKK